MIEISLLWSSFALANVSTIFTMTIIEQMKTGARRISGDREGCSIFSARNSKVIRLPVASEIHHNATLKQ